MQAKDHVSVSKLIGRVPLSKQAPRFTRLRLGGIERILFGTYSRDEHGKWILEPGPVLTAENKKMYCSAYERIVEHLVKQL